MNFDVFPMVESILNQLLLEIIRTASNGVRKHTMSIINNILNDELCFLVVIMQKLVTAGDIS